MSIPCLHPNFIDPLTEYTYFLHDNSTVFMTGFHSHQFYEIFLILDGMFKHEVNGSTANIKRGTLVFMRPNDTHRISLLSKNGHFINVEILPCAIDSLSRYLGAGFGVEAMLWPPQPPHIVLDGFERNRLRAHLEKLARKDPPEDKTVLRARLRSILADIVMSDFAIAQPRTLKSTPEWVQQLCLQMRKPENFSVGTERMTELANRTHEHICRVFQTHLGCTPTQYVNRLRINYAAGLLTTTDRKITWIAQDAGFSSLSRFYEEFNAQFDISPAEFRKTRLRTSQDPDINPPEEEASL